MLEEKDLQAIAQLMDQKLAEQDKRLDQKLAEQRKDIMQSAAALLDAEFTPKFNLLAENQQIIMEKLEPLEDLPVLEARVSALETMVKKLNRQVNQLKKAQ